MDEIIPADCKNIFTTAAETALDLTEFELNEHQIVDKAGKGGNPDKTVIRANVPQAWSDCHDPGQYLKGIKVDKTHTTANEMSRERELILSEAYDINT